VSAGRSDGISFSLPIFAFLFSCGTPFSYMSTTHEPLSAWCFSYSAPEIAEYARLRVAAIELTTWRRLADSERLPVGGCLGLLGQDLSEQRWAFAAGRAGTGMYAC
jgi:hypothetical protein